MKNAWGARPRRRGGAALQPWAVLVRRIGALVMQGSDCKLFATRLEELRNEHCNSPFAALGATCATLAECQF